MPTATIVRTRQKSASGSDRLGRSASGFGGGNFGGGWEAYGWRVPARTYRTGMWVALAAIVMLFAALSSALVVRRGLGSDWVTTPLPRILWLNSLLLVISSLTLELSRKSLGVGMGYRFARWWYTTVGLGLAFIAGQLVAWRELAVRGVYLSTNPSSSFFYLLTALHGVHLLGGLIALLYIAVRRSSYVLAPERRMAMDVTAIYWHFMDGLWIYVFLLLKTIGG